MKTLTINADRLIGECYPFWIVANCNRPQHFLDPAYGAGLKVTQPHVEAMNAVYLLGGRLVDANTFYKGLNPDGTLRADFGELVAQLKNMVASGYTPWPVLDNVPYNMSDPPSENAYGNTAPPVDEALWGRYVQAAMEALVDAFGRDTVASWWLRVGTEPDLRPGHWDGTKEQFLEHYDHTVAAVDRVIPESRIGPGNILNPAAPGGEFGTTRREHWGLDLIDHCGGGTNHVTGRTGSRMDWFSWTCYGRVGQPLTVFDSAVSRVRERLSRYPGFRDTPLMIGEFAVLHDEFGKRLWSGDTTEWGASFYASVAGRVYHNGILQVYEWAETTHGVPHPRAHVVGLLQQMRGGQRLYVDATPVVDPEKPDSGAIGSRKGDDLYVLVFNHHHLRTPKLPESLRLVLSDGRMEAGHEWSVSEWTVDADHTVWAHAFDADCAAAGVIPLPNSGRFEGSPERRYGEPGEEVFRKHAARYAELSILPRTRNAERARVDKGKLTLTLDMPGHSVRLLRFSPPGLRPGAP